MCNVWVISQANRRKVLQCLCQRRNGWDFCFSKCQNIWNTTSEYLSCHKILALWPYVLECTHAQSSNQRAHPKQQEVKLYLVASQTEYWETCFTYVNSPPAKDNCPAETSANHQVILLSCDFLFSFLTSVVQRSRGSVSSDREDYGCRHSIGSHYSPQSAPGTLSLPLFSHPLSFCLFSLLSSDRLRSN